MNKLVGHVFPNEQPVVEPPRTHLCNWHRHDKRTWTRANSTSSSLLVAVVVVGEAVLATTDLSLPGRGEKENTGRMLCFVSSLVVDMFDSLVTALFALALGVRSIRTTSCSTPALH